jgi:hypothetical protein
MMHVNSCLAATAGGPDTEQLEEELAAQQAQRGTAHAEAGLVSFLVKPRIEIVSKDRMVAQGGKFITVTGGLAGMVRHMRSGCSQPSCWSGAGGWRAWWVACGMGAATRSLCVPACRTMQCQAMWLLVAGMGWLPERLLQQALKVYHAVRQECVLTSTPGADTFGEMPNGSAWAITTGAAPELDATHLVVARVVEVGGQAQQGGCFHG